MNTEMQKIMSAYCAIHSQNYSITLHALRRVTLSITKQANAICFETTWPVRNPLMLQFGYWRQC